MSVVDASAMVAALVGRSEDPALLDALSADIDAPHPLDVEVLSVLRGLVLGRKLTLEEANQARAEFYAFTIQRHETAPLADRIWELRHQFTTYDAHYVALAEALHTTLFTCDGKLAGRGHGAHVRLAQQFH